MHKDNQTLGTWHTLNDKNIPQEISLLGLTETADPNMREELLLQNVLGVLDPLLPGHSRLRSPCANEVQCYTLLLDDECLIKG